MYVHVRMYIHVLCINLSLSLTLSLSLSLSRSLSLALSLSRSLALSLSVTHTHSLGHTHTQYSTCILQPRATDRGRQRAGFVCSQPRIVGPQAGFMGEGWGLGFNSLDSGFGNRVYVVGRTMLAVLRIMMVYRSL